MNVNILSRGVINKRKSYVHFLNVTFNYRTPANSFLNSFIMEFYFYYLKHYYLPKICGQLTKYQFRPEYVYCI